MRHTKIICTLGPKTESQEMIEQLIEAGMNVARINMSHGDPEWHKQVIHRARAAKTNWKFPIAIMVDTQGPEIRTSATEATLEEGDTFKIAVSSACDIQEHEKHTFVNYSELTKSVKVGDTVLIDDGLIGLEVTEIDDHHITCKVLNKGQLGQRKSVNLPGVSVNLPALTDRDKESIKAVVDEGIDFVAQSFVTKKEDVQEMRAFLDSIKCDAKIIAKIEDQEGIANIDEIIAESDAVMVARGDMGVELPLEEIPLMQHMIVKRCKKAGKPVIVATHLLESMIEHPRPTRAEVTDVANAVFQKADAIMLSGETTKGEYPLESVSTMHKIAKKTQSKLKFDYNIASQEGNDVHESMSLAACVNAENIKAKAILVFSQTGWFAGRVAQKRPNIDIFAFTDSKEVQNQLMLTRGTVAYCVDFAKGFNEMVDQAKEVLKDQGFVQKGDRVVIVSDILPRKGIETLEVRDID